MGKLSDLALQIVTSNAPWPTGRPVVLTDPPPLGIGREAFNAALAEDKLSSGQQIMVEDGFPPAAIIAPDERAALWKGRKLTKPRDIKAPRKDEDPVTKGLRKELEAAEAAKKAERFARLTELKAQKKDQAMKTELAKTGKADQVKVLRERRASTKGAPKAAKKASSKKAAKTKARTPASPKPAAAAPRGIRPGSKLEIVAGLLTRKQGCTSAEVLAATDWPAVSMPQQARAAGLTLRQEKDGKVTRYWGTPA